MKYDESALGGGKTAGNIGHSQITGIPTPYATKKPCHECIQSQQLPCNQNKNVCNHSDPSQPHENAGIAAILSHGHSNNQGEGWRVQELGFVHESGHKSQDFKARM